MRMQRYLWSCIINKHNYWKSELFVESPYGNDNRRDRLENKNEFVSFSELKASCPLFTCVLWIRSASCFTNYQIPLASECGKNILGRNMQCLWNHSSITQLSVVQYLHGAYNTLSRFWTVFLLTDCAILPKFISYLKHKQTCQVECCTDCCIAMLHCYRLLLIPICT